MELEKSKKRIAKKVKMGFQGFPKLSISYFGVDQLMAEHVEVVFVAEEGSQQMKEIFQSKFDAREDQVIQSAIVKMIERTGVKTVRQSLEVKIKQ